MIKTTLKTYEEYKTHVAPPLRRTSRDPERDSNLKEIEDIEIYYKTRTSNIQNVVNVLRLFKELKKTSNIIQNLFTEKYGENFGTIFSKWIMEDYLEVKDETTQWYSYWFGEDNVFPYIHTTINVDKHENMVHHDENIGLIIDPRLKTFTIDEVIPYMKNGYSTICSFIGGTNNWRILAKSRSPKYNHQIDDDYWSDDDAEIPTMTY